MSEMAMQQQGMQKRRLELQGQVLISQIRQTGGVLTFEPLWFIIFNQMNHRSEP